MCVFVPYPWVVKAALQLKCMSRFKQHQAPPRHPISHKNSRRTTRLISSPKKLQPTPHTLHMLHMTSHQAPHRLNVTFSEDTEASETPSATIGASVEHTLKRKIEHKFASIQVCADKLPAIIAQLFNDVGVIQTPRNQLYQLGPTGVWKLASLALVRNTMARELLEHQLKQYNGYKSKIARVLQSGAASAAVIKHMDDIASDHLAALEELTRSNHFRALIKQSLAKMQRHEVDQDQDVVAFNDRVYTVAMRLKLPLNQRLKLTERDELKQLRVTRSLSYPASTVLATQNQTAGHKAPLTPSPASWLEANGVDKSRIETLQWLLGTALMANRPAPNTVVQFVGAGAASLATALQAIAGELALAAPVRDLAALTTRQAPTTLHRWTLISTDETSIKYAGRAVQKLKSAHSVATTLPIILSCDGSPVLLPDSWSVVYVPVHLAIDVVTADAAGAWYRWMLAASDTPTTTTNPTTSAALVRSLAGPVVDDFLAVRGWRPPCTGHGAEPARRSTSTLASIVPAVEKVAASRALGALPITQHLLTELLEQRKFCVTRPANRLTVEWYSGT